MAKEPDDEDYNGFSSMDRIYFRPLAEWMGKAQMNNENVIGLPEYRWNLTPEYAS